MFRWVWFLRSWSLIISSFGTHHCTPTHRDRLRSLVYHAQARKLISTSDDGVMGIWNMDIERQEVWFVCVCVHVCMAVAYSTVANVDSRVGCRQLL